MCQTGELDCGDDLVEAQIPRWSNDWRSIIIATGDLAVCAAATAVKAIIVGRLYETPCFSAASGTDALQHLAFLDGNRRTVSNEGGARRLI